jgi:hypothetical protein
MDLIVGFGDNTVLKRCSHKIPVAFCIIVCACGDKLFAKDMLTSKMCRAAILLPRG